MDQNSFRFFNTTYPQDYMVQSLIEDSAGPSTSNTPTRNIETSSEVLLIAGVIEKELVEIKDEYIATMKKLKSIENNFKSMKTFLEHELKRKSFGSENQLFNEVTEKAIEVAISREPNGLAANNLKKLLEEFSPAKKREVVLKYAIGKLPQLFSQLLHIERYLRKRKLEKVELSKLRLLNKMKQVITAVEELMSDED